MTDPARTHESSGRVGQAAQSLQPSQEESSIRNANPEVRAILDFAAEHGGIDFRDYRSQTLLRGIQDRLRATGCQSASEYLRQLAEQPDELERLIEALVVPVTAFFRDPAVFAALAAFALPKLLTQASSERPLRVWNIGVSTGEESWSIAMLIDSLWNPLGSSLENETGNTTGAPFDVLGTDIDEQALRCARRGGYPAQSIAAIPAELRARYVRQGSDASWIAPELQAHVRFASHDIMGRRIAPPEAIVASFGLVMIRNVLIYFDRRLQTKACERLVSLVEPGGILVLGPVETLPEQLALFFAPLPGVDPQLRIYQRIDQSVDPPSESSP